MLNPNDAQVVVQKMMEAVAEERERCAKIAETARPQLYALPTMHLSNEEALAFAENIAQRIRSGE